VAYYLGRLRAERDSQETADDATADATRLGAPDLVPTVPLTRRY
jgi:glycerol-3-phosphate dehydrogenase